MKSLIALVASIAVNASVLGALEWNVYAAQTPQGNVTVAQLDTSKALPTYAQVDSKPRSRWL